MLIRLIQCRRDGLRLREAEWAAPLTGHLEVLNLESKGGSRTRFTRFACVRAKTGAYENLEIDVVPPIYDPQLLPSPRGQLLIRGVELQTEFGQRAHKVWEHEQVWLCWVGAKERPGVKKCLAE